jgi:hypothetical protein
LKGEPTAETPQLALLDRDGKNPLNSKPNRDKTHMAKQKKELKEKPIEVTLWDAANKLRGSVEPAEEVFKTLGYKI